ncbi:MAG TPA: S9 family peptidase [Ktedonobacteraceae bacterium]|jgi:dipeptidyl aminopeptidase/acylaminoacyl peptidase|nr:S9 family peptidase [Ktedonobacteraceae bacterium]
MNEEKRALTLEDFWALKLVTDAQLAPDGTSVAYVVGDYDEQQNQLRSAIWLASLATGQTRQLTSGESQDMQPRWSPDGTQLAFVSTRHEGKPQIYLIDVDGGEARRLTNVTDGATSPLWAPDGKQLCYSAAPETDLQKVPQETAWFEAHAEVAKQAPRLRRQSGLLSRFDGQGYIERRMHLFLINVQEPDIEPRQLTAGDYDALQATWSPDGALIALVANRADDAEYSLANDIWTLEVASGEMKCLTTGDLSCLFPSWSPDGQSIAFFAEPPLSSRQEYQDPHLWLVSRTGGDQRDASKQFDQSTGAVQPDYLFGAGAAPTWAPDGQTIYYVIADHGANTIFALTRETGQGRRISSTDADIAALQCTADGQTLVGVAATSEQPYDLFTLPRSGGELTFLVNSNRRLLDEVAIAPTEKITFTGPDGWEIEGWLVKPLQVERPYPLILHVHGGPYSAWGHSFYFQAQALAGAGYASLYINPRGSKGYGLAFTRAADWGEKDYLDLLAGVDAVLARGEVDPQKLGITGISYGGFMTNWALGHTERFAAGVTVNGIGNFASFYGTSDVGALWFGTQYGHFWESEEAWQFYRAHSPITYVDHISAPLLLLQSENDYRCPIEQGEQMLTALRVRHQTVELIRFPNASHAIAATASPHHRYFQWKLTLDWFGRHIKASER